MTRDTGSLLNAALAAAERGWHVFPIQPGRKKPPALHGDTKDRPCPRTGVCRDGHQGFEQRSTTNPDRIRSAWEHNPRFNVGIAPGPSDLLVVDFDLPKSASDRPVGRWNREGVRDGLDVFTALCEEHGQEVPWDTCTVRSARGGTHLYFQAPEGVRLRNTEGEQGNGLGWKVDTRAWGGYVVAPGSITPDGRYELVHDRQPPPLPTWLVELLRPKPVVPTTVPPPRSSERLIGYVESAITGECARVRAAQPTRHSRTLFGAAGNLGQLVGAGVLPPVRAEDELYVAAQHMITDRCQCTEAEVRRTIANGLRAGAARPRALPDTAVTATAPLWNQRGAA